jgi:hypothetical protein
MEVFLCVGILKPTTKEQEEGASPKIIFQPQAVIAKDRDQAVMKAHRFLPNDVEGKEDRIEIRVLPFRGPAC